jgi:hypothetical protein
MRANPPNSNLGEKSWMLAEYMPLPKKNTPMMKPANAINMPHSLAPKEH